MLGLPGVSPVLRRPQRRVTESDRRRAESDSCGSPRRRDRRSHADDSERVGATRWIILLGLITAAIMEVLDTTIVNVALPQMAGNLGATQQEISWVSTGYILSNVVVLPMTAFFTERFGRRRYLTASIILFAVASFLCGTSHSLVELVIWRIVQGAGGAALLSTAQATHPPDLPARAAGPGPGRLPPGHHRRADAGPHARRLDHRQLHLELVLLHQRADRDRLDLPGHDVPQGPARASSAARGEWTGSGSACSPSGLGALQYVLEEGNQDDWFNDPLILRLAIVAGVCLVTMLWWELTPRNRHPVVELPGAQEPRAGGLDLPLRGARVRPLRRRVHLPALHPEPAPLHPHRDRARAAARRPRHRGHGAHLRAAAQRCRARWWTRGS